MSNIHGKRTMAWAALTLSLLGAAAALVAAYGWRWAWNRREEAAHARAMAARRSLAAGT